VNILDPAVRERRALRYWHKYGRFPFDRPGYDPRTGLVDPPRRRTLPPVSPVSPVSTVHNVNMSQCHIVTSTHHPSPNIIESYIHIEPLSVPVPIRDPTDSDEGSDTGTERTPYWLQPLVMSEKGERDSQGITSRDYGHAWQSAYRARIGEMPDCGPGDRAKAETYWFRICQALDMQEGTVGESPWTIAENNRLHLLERKWRARKDGRDPRFEVAGTRRGRLGEGDRKRLEDVKVRIESKWERLTWLEDEKG
jgi:hypothetical protein